MQHYRCCSPCKRHIHRTRGASTRPNAPAPGNRLTYQVRSAKPGRWRSHQAMGFTIGRRCPNVHQARGAIPGKRHHSRSGLSRHTQSEMPPIGLWRYNTLQASSCAPGQIEAPPLDQKRPHQVVTQPRPLWGMSQICGLSIRTWDPACHGMRCLPGQSGSHWPGDPQHERWIPRG